MHYRPRPLCLWRLYVLFCFSNFSFCGHVLGYRLVKRRLCFHASKSLRMIPPKQNLILRTSIEDGSIDNQKPLLINRSNWKTQFKSIINTYINNLRSQIGFWKIREVWWSISLNSFKVIQRFPKKGEGVGASKARSRS